MEIEDARAKAERIKRAVHIVRSSPYIPKQIEPSAPQWAFIASDQLEVLYAGSVGGGKSVALLAAALMYAHVPGYSALIIRKNFPDLSQPGGLMSMANEWLGQTDAHKQESGKLWTFPSGATLKFGHIETPGDWTKYQGGEYQFIGIDELPQLESSIWYDLKTRLRRSTSMHPDLADVPDRMRGTGNPGGKHAKWVKNYFISDDDGNPVRVPNRAFMPSRITDNPSLDLEKYSEILDALDPVRRAQMRDGDWDIMPQGNMFHEENFIKTPGRLEGGGAYRIRMWDLAGSAKKKSDYCAGVLLARSKTTGIYRVEHIVHEKLEPGPLDRKMREIAELDGRDVWIGLEQEKSGAGMLVSAHFRRLLQGFVVRPQKPTGDKVERAGLASSLVDTNMVELTIAPWNDKFISECVSFPTGANDDMVDAFAYACHALSRMPISNQSAAGSSEAPPGKRGGGVPAGGGASELPRFLVNRLPDSAGGSRRRTPPSNPLGPRFGGGPWVR